MRPTQCLWLVFVLCVWSCSSGSSGDGGDADSTIINFVEDQISFADKRQPPWDVGHTDQGDDAHIKPDIPHLPLDVVEEEAPFVEEDVLDVVPLDLPVPDLPDTGVPETGGETTVGEVVPADALEPPPAGDPVLQEPGIRILGPSSTGGGQSLGAGIQVAGIVAGKPDAVLWETSSGQTGNAQGDPFWVTGKIDLQVGDNKVVVRAIKGDLQATDQIIITYNPAFMFGSHLHVTPGFLFVNAESDLIFSIDMGLYGNFDAQTLYVCEATQSGQCLTEIHKMMDDGQVNISGDGMAEDSVFSWRKKYKVGMPGKLCFRAHAIVKSGFMQYSAFSPTACVDVVERISQESCQSMVALQQEAEQLYYETLEQSDAGAARQKVIGFLQAQGEVSEVGSTSQGFGVWVRYVNGVLGAFNFSPAGYRGGQGEGSEQLLAPIGVDDVLVSSKRSVTLGPAHSELGGLDEAVFIDGLLRKTECPTYVVDGPYLDGAASLQRFRNLFEYGIIAIAGHGDSYFKQLSATARQQYGWIYPYSQEVLWTGEPVDCSKFAQSSPVCSGPGTCPDGARCVVTEADTMGTAISGICLDFKQADLRRGRAVLGTQNFGILPAFIRHYRDRGYPDSLVYLGACRSLWNGTLGMEFFAAGAKAVVGYSGYVTSTFAYEQGTSFFSNLIEGLVTAGAAMPKVLEEDPDNPGSSIALLGGPNLNVTDSNLINPSWETGDLTGWQKTGDGRVISRLGVSLPVEGKFMGVVSTGMGYTPQTGEIFQTFCIAEDFTEASFYWKLASEEFKEWCGTMFQDTFEATMEGSEGLLTLASMAVDDLCPPEDCVNCGNQYEGLTQCDFLLDQGDCWMTTWRPAKVDVTQLAGMGAVTLRFYATDVGDSLYDSVILLDTVKLK